MERLQELGPKHHAAVRMRLEGQSNKQIAEHLDVKERTLHVWFSDQLVKDELESQLNRVNEVFAERLATNAMAGLDSMKELLEVPLRDADVSYSSKLEAVSDMLDRNPATAKVGANREGNSVSVTVGQLSDSELLSKAREIFGKTTEQAQIVESEAVEIEND